MRLVTRQNDVIALWVLAYKGITGNEFADGLAEEAVEALPCDALVVPDQIRWQAGLSHLTRRAERRSRDTAQWVAAHVRPEHRYHPPGASGLRRR